jgi:hypothetical protein
VKHSSHMVKMALSQEDRAHTPELHFSRTFQSRTSLSDFMWMSRKKKCVQFHDKCLLQFCFVVSFRN